jgi:hypothetical protein
MEYREITLRVPKLKFPRVRFKISALVALILMCAIGFGAFRIGSTAGYDKGLIVGRQTGWSDAMSESLSIEVYKVSDLVVPIGKKRSDPDATMLALVDEIKKSVNPPSWSCNQGAAKISTYMGSLSLAVRQTPEGHEALTEFLRKKKRSQQ